MRSVELLWTIVFDMLIDGMDSVKVDRFSFFFIATTVYWW